MIQMSATCLAADFDGQLFVSRVTRGVPLVKHQLLPHPKHLRSPQVFSGVRVARSLVFSVLFCRSLFVLLSLFIWTCYCFFFFDLRVRSLVSSAYLWVVLDDSFYDFRFNYSIIIPTSPPPPMQPFTSIFYCLHICFPHVWAV
jgi:hypothetical protein